MTRKPFDVAGILIGGVAFIGIAAVGLSLIIFAVGETVEHFTP